MGTACRARRMKAALLSRHGMPCPYNDLQSGSMWTLPIMWTIIVGFSDRTAVSAPVHVFTEARGISR